MIVQRRGARKNDHLKTIQIFADSGTFNNIEIAGLLKKKMKNTMI